MYGDYIRNAISELADILNRNKNEITIRSREPMVLPLIPQKNNEETRVIYQENLLPKLQQNYDIIKKKNALAVASPIHFLILSIFIVIYLF